MRKIRFYISIILILASLAGLSYAIYLAEYGEAAIYDKYAKEKYSLLTDELSTKVQMEVAKISQGVSGLAISLGETGVSEEMIKGVLDNYGITEWMFCDTNGQAVLWDKSQRDVSFCPYYTRALAGNTSFVRTGFEDEEDNSNVLTVPVQKNGEVTGVLRVSVPDSIIKKTLSLTDFRGKESIFLIDRGGDILFTSSGITIYNTNIFDFFEKDSKAKEEIEQDIFQGRNHFVLVSENLTEPALGKKPFYVCYAPVADTVDWGVMMVLEESTLMNFVKDDVIKQKLLDNIHAIVCAAIFAIVLFTFNAIDTRVNTKLYRLAYYDEVTGSRNLNYFVEHATEVLERNSNTQTAIVIVGLKKYQYLKEFFGNDEMNRILSEISKVIDSNLKNNDYYCHNFGEEFILCLQFHNQDELKDRIRFMNEALEGISRVLGDTEKYSIQFAYGVACKEKDAKDLDILISRANLAIINAKSNPATNIEFYNSKMLSRQVDEQEIERDMFEALENHDFLIYLQPKFDLVTGGQVGAEALVRWMHAEKGLMYPGRFINTFEKNGFITKLDMYILEELCRRIKVWMGKGYRTMPLSLNISRLNLFNRDFVDEAIAIVEKYGVSPEMITFEIAESIVAENMQLAGDIISKLKEYGFVIAMDNFGTGSTSMNTLYSIPMDELKMDRKFFLSAEKSNRGQSVIQSVVEISKRLDIKVVSEGVENKQQAFMLRDLGCDMIQGFAFSEPLPEREYEEYAYGPRARENNIW